MQGLLNIEFQYKINHSYLYASFLNDKYNKQNNYDYDYFNARTRLSEIVIQKEKMKKEKETCL